jgi:hypothetical protein
MRRLISLLGALAIIVGVSGLANAGYWSVSYDLTGSTIFTNAGGSTNIDPVVGTWRINYDGPYAGPVSGANMAAGRHKLLQSNPAGGLFLLTGVIDTTLLPDGSEVNAVAATAITMGPVADARIRGFIHCYNGIFNCTAAGFTHTTQKPQTPPAGSTNPVNIGKLQFTGVVGNSDFTSTPQTQVIPPNPPTSPVTVTLISTYVGKEVSRYWITGEVPAMSTGGLIGLGLFLLLGGTSTLALRRGRGIQRAG